MGLFSSLGHVTKFEYWHSSISDIFFWSPYSYSFYQVPNMTVEDAGAPPADDGEFWLFGYGYEFA